MGKRLHIYYVGFTTCLALMSSLNDLPNIMGSPPIARSIILFSFFRETRGDGSFVTKCLIVNSLKNENATSENEKLVNFGPLAERPKKETSVNRSPSFGQGDMSKCDQISDCRLLEQCHVRFVGSEFWALTQRPKKETSVNRSPSFGQWDI
jgi:hypothetical protein